MKSLLVSKFSNLPVARKIWGLAGFLMLVNLMVVGTILLQLNSIKSEIGEISSEHMPLTEITTSLTVHQLEQAVQFERGLRVAEHLNSNPSAAQELAQIEKHFSELGHKIGKEVKQAEALAETVIEHTQIQTVREEYEKILSGFKHYEKAHVTFESHVHEVFEGAKAGALDIHQIEKLAHKIEKEEDALDHEIESLLAEIERFTARSLEIVDQHEQSAFLLGLILTVVSIALALPVAFFIIGGIVRPLDLVVDALDVLATGDTSRDVEASSEDEIGKTARAYEILRQKTIEARDLTAQQEAEMKRQRKELIENLSSEFDSCVKDVLGGVSTSVSNLEQSANAMASTVEETSQKSTVVASATEQTVANAQTVASATEEMDNSIREISTQVQQSASIAKQAVEEAAHTNDSVQSLEGAAREIGEVVSLISEIAEQTNLLALNATIEAARAGESGKGFAVVASEVKELANQTAKATDTISHQIESIQAGTTGAASAIENIATTISKMDEIASAIAAAVEEQSATTTEIAQNIQQVAQGSQESMEAMSEVKTAADDTGKVADQVLTASRDLMSRSDMLSKSVDDFMQGIKAA